MEDFFEDFGKALYYAFARVNSIFPNLEYEIDHTNMIFEKNFISNVIELKKNYKEMQIPIFLINYFENSKDNNMNKESLDSFIKLRSNKEAMKLIFIKFSNVFLSDDDDRNISSDEFKKTNDDNGNLSFDEFMKAKPDSELQSIFFLLFTIEKNCDFKNLIEKNFLKLDKRAQIDVIRQMIRNMKLYSFLFKEINLNDIYVNIFQKFSKNKIDIDIIEQLIDGSLLLEDIDKFLINFEDNEI